MSPERPPLPAPPQGLIALAPWVLAVVVVGIYGVAALMMTADFANLRALRNVRPADHAANGPAIYTGTLVGPADRVTPSGEQAAMHWSWVRSTDSDSPGTYCVTNARDQVSLSTPEGTLPIRWLDDSTSISVRSNESDDAPATREIFTGPNLERDIKGFPGALATCAGDSRASVIHSVPQGTKAEVISCAQDGGLELCAREPHGLIAIPTVKAAMVAKASRIHTTFRIAGIASLVLALGIGFLCLVARNRSLDVLRPRDYA